MLTTFEEMFKIVLLSRDGLPVSPVFPFCYLMYSTRENGEYIQKERERERGYRTKPAHDIQRKSARILPCLLRCAILRSSCQGGGRFQGQQNVSMSIFFSDVALHFGQGEMEGIYHLTVMSCHIKCSPPSFGGLVIIKCAIELRDKGSIFWTKHFLTLLLLLYA